MQPVAPFLPPLTSMSLQKDLQNRKLGVNWVSCFVQCHRDIIHLNLFANQKAERLKADTPETKEGFLQSDMSP